MSDIECSINAHVAMIGAAALLVVLVALGFHYGSGLVRCMKGGAA